ncbi:hypothetical protein APR11_002236 [Nocardia amikacinitolerans]|uniref:hypothetical protein n=1 Tax=Nocardia amikacinitolerans TaxID=756689 RepID=UPI0020A5F12D|nr:hypothetical protein [Nocardia amikacinitolerans]MCP2295818.1 hypothetical protein [Nocardia amikacinitolerans]
MPYQHAGNQPPPTGAPKAVGLIRAAVSGPRLARHANEIRWHAVRSGYWYVYTVRPPADEPNPVGYALIMARALGAEVVVVFDLAQVDDRPALVCEAGFDLETVSPPGTWTRCAEPDPCATSPEGGMWGGRFDALGVQSSAGAAR